MTIKELKEKLNFFPDDLTVVVEDLEYDTLFDIVEIKIKYVQKKRGFYKPSLSDETKVLVIS